MTPADDDSPRDLRGDLVVMLTTTGLLLLIFGSAAATQTVFVYLPERLTFQNVLGTLPELGIRLAANLVAVASAVCGAALVRLNERHGMTRFGLVVGISAAASGLRFAAQLVLDVNNGPTWPTVVVENVTALVVVLVSLLFGLSQSDTRVLLRREERARTRQEVRAANALADLSAAELKTRREIAEGLHGTVQQQLVLADVQLRMAIERLRSLDVPAEELAELERLRSSLDDVRERDVRELSQLLYPVGVDLGVAAAVRLVLRRVPPTIATDVAIEPALEAGGAAAGGLDIERRVILVRLLEEGITNALKHGRAGRIGVRLSLETAADATRRVVLTVDDDGEGLAEGAGRSGLARLGERAEHLGGSVSLGSSPLGGVRLAAALPAAAASVR